MNTNPAYLYIHVWKCVLTMESSRDRSRIFILSYILKGDRVALHLQRKIIRYLNGIGYSYFKKHLPQGLQLTRKAREIAVRPGVSDFSRHMYMQEWMVGETEEMEQTLGESEFGVNLEM